METENPKTRNSKSKDLKDESFISKTELVKPWLQEAFTQRNNVLSSPQDSSPRQIPSTPTSFSPVKRVTIPLYAAMPSLTKTQVEQQNNSH